MKLISCDLLVVGGGVAGCCAAVAAARRGVRTILVERKEHLGGTGFSGMLQHICGLYLNGDSIPSETLNGGLTHEIVQLLMNTSSGTLVQKIGQVYVLPYNANSLQEVLGSLLESESTLTVMRNTAVTGVESNYGKILSVTTEVPGRTQGITPAVVVDCTGNGDVAAMAGAEFELSPLNERQLAGFSIRIGGLEIGDSSLAIKVPYVCAQAVLQKILPLHMKFTSFNYGDTPDEGFIKMSLDGEDSPERDALARKNAHILLAHLGQVLPPFKDARITGTALNVQDREGRRIIGDYILTGEDILTARKFPDAIVKNAWPIELWDRSKGTLYKYVPRGDYYEIPFRSITVKGLSNLLTAGRCISVSREALGSTRVMGTCMALGEQAGLATASCVRNGEYRSFITRQT
jgi:hypothetical protein